MRKGTAAALAAATLAGCGSASSPVVQPSPTAAPPAGACHIVGSGLFSAPDRMCTPGQWIADTDLSTAHVCRHGYNPRPPLSVTSRLKARALREYGDAPSLSSTVEADHLFPVWLGGATTLANFWPEPNYARAPDSFTHNPKDALEFRIYRLTCQSRSLSVPQARAIFAGDWRAAYAKYVGPAKP